MIILITNQTIVTLYCVKVVIAILVITIYLKLTRHNGRAGAHGTYNPKHNDRSFNLANSEHIDQERAKSNIYWDCYHGIRSASDKDKQTAAFSDVEKMFYEIHYAHFVENQNARNAKIRHTERNRTILRRNQKHEVMFIEQRSQRRTCSPNR